ncbi:endonuclease MutS2 [Caldalkalibacillus thermarum]|uniref:endonuclease MutS2 n=1 Tax=Caldalkalibacillus thermarum TaxID=296745 RepID=UPI00166C2FAC|nr:endonuclease MutS2 [Caldalkalibacillus thermarum]GGK33846.1 endonuclease MutS2 [Caldalkalibacillus thermarum]
MQERTLKLLEFDKIKDELAKHAASTLGKEKVEELTPVFDLDVVRKEQQATYEAFTVLRLKGQVPFGGIRDIRPAVKRAMIGSRLDAAELLDVAQTIAGGRKLKHFLEKVCAEHGELSILARLEEQIRPLRDVEQSIKSCIDEHGDVLDSASPALKEIRNRIRHAEQRVKRQLEQIVRAPANQKMLQEPIITIRQDRYCIPVKAEYRHHFGGLVHDQSASGATLFVEPEAVVAINNELREAKLQEEKEIDRILTGLTRQVGEAGEDLKNNVQALAELDFLFAKAYYARSIRAVQPQLNDQGYFKLIRARHPLIPAQDVVPTTFELGREYTCMVITGPNTGGKTVTLKTLGLLTLMACSGLFIPAEEGSHVAVVSSVYADIGDEQSIEQSLSTFSSHMTHIVGILDKMDENSLLLFDELGAGTDPTEGAALAMAILDFVHSRGALVVATTHYSELKAYAYSRPGVINASVEFDTETLKPTYRLLVGVPGRSNAFHIARRLGLKEEIIETAKNLISTDDLRIDHMLAELESARKQAEEDRQAAERLKREVEALKQSLAKKEARLEKEKERLISQAKQQAEQKIERMMKEAERIMAQLREWQRGHQAVKEHQLIEAKKGLEQLKEAASQQPAGMDKPRPKRQNGQTFKPGDDVYVHTFGQKGQVIEKLSEQEYYVQLGIIKMKVKASDMEKIKTKQTEQAGMARVQTKTETVGLELDVRGQTTDEAIAAVDKYLDDALLAGYQQVSIIHGKGTGQLRKGIQDFLRRHKRVKAFRLGEAGEGGSGVTIVTLS